MKITRQGAVDSEGYLLDSEGEIKEKFDPDKKLNIIHVFYWYNDLQGRLKQEFHPPGYYRGKPRIYVKESVEKISDNELLSHLRVYYGKKLLAETEVLTEEYRPGRYETIGDTVALQNFEPRAEIRTKVNYLINEGAWKLYTPDRPRFRKTKKIKPKTRKPIKKITKKPKKVVRKKVVKKRK